EIRFPTDTHGSFEPGKRPGQVPLAEGQETDPPRGNHKARGVRHRLGNPEPFITKGAARSERAQVGMARSCTSNLRLIRQPDRPGKIPSLLSLYEGLWPWSPLSFSTSWCSSPWCGCVACSIGCGQATPLPRA